MIQHNTTNCLEAGFSVGVETIVVGSETSCGVHLRGTKGSLNYITVVKFEMVVASFKI